MAIPDNSIRLGYFDSNDDNPRSVWVTQPAYETFLQQIRTVLANPAPIKSLVRARVSAFLGPAFDGETDDWVFRIVTAAWFVWNIPNEAEIEQLRAELLPEP